MLVVAHRLGTARGADQIAVLEAGALAETGTHGDLIGHDGPYARLVKASSSRPKLASMGVPRQAIQPQHPEQVLLEDWAAEVLRERTSKSPHARDRRAGTLLRLLGFLWPYGGRVGLAVGLGFWTVASNLGLLAVSGYLIAAASLKPSFGNLDRDHGPGGGLRWQPGIRTLRGEAHLSRRNLQAADRLEDLVVRAPRTPLPRSPRRTSQRRFALQDGQRRGGA